MFGMMFLIRLIELALALTIAAGIIVGFAWLINRGIQLTAGLLGYEVRDFFEWFRSTLPKRKRKVQRK